MTVTITLTVGADAFALQETLADHADVTVRIERVVPLGETLCPFVWVSGGDADAIERSLRADRDVRSVRTLSTVDDETLYRIEWKEGFDGLARSVVESSGTLLDAVATGGDWQLTLRFDEHEQASSFHRLVAEYDVPMTIDAIHNPAEGGSRVATTSLTDVQRESLLTAYERGYFDIPREITLSDLAEHLGISDTALSQRIRRGTKRLVGESLVESDSTR